MKRKEAAETAGALFLLCARCFMNRVVLMGRLTREPDIRYSQGENPMCVARYTLAVDRRRRGSNNGTNSNNNDEADFISCVAFGKTGEFAEKWLHKGTKIAVVGRLRTGSYTNRDGIKVYTTDVVVDEHEFAESRRAADASRSGQGMQNGSQNPQQNSNGYTRGQYNGTNNPSNNGPSRQNQNNNGMNTQNGGQPGGGSYNGYDNALDGFMNIPDGIDEELPFT